MPFENLPRREEYLRKKRNKKILRYGITVFLLLFIIGLVSYISHRSELRVSGVDLTGGVLVTGEDVEKESFEYLKGSYFWLFPKNNIFWYPRRALKEHLKEKFKRIDTINIVRKDLQTISVEISERKPFAVWCGGGPTDSGEEKCFFLDQNSTIFAPAPNFSGDAYFKYYGLVSPGDPIGKEYLSATAKFYEISSFVDATKGMLVKPLYLLAKNDHEFSLVVHGGGEIIFDTQEPLEKVAENLEALLRTPELKFNSAGDLPVEYIDLRYGNKLFYKLKTF